MLPRPEPMGPPMLGARSPVPPPAPSNARGPSPGGGGGKDEMKSQLIEALKMARKAAADNGLNFDEIVAASGAGSSAPKPPLPVSAPKAPAARPSFP